MALKINRMISKYNFYIGNVGRLRDGYIVIHYVGATGSAKQNCEYYAQGHKGASAHYFVGHDGEIWQSVEDKNSAWHCGSSSGYKHPKCRNSNSIGIELCCRTTGNTSKADANWYFEDATIQAAIELVKELMEKYNIPEDHVIRHYDVTGKTCPAPFVFNSGKHTWEKFKLSLKGIEVDKIQNKENSQKNQERKLPEIPFKVRVSIDDLNIRKGPGTDHQKTGKCTGKGVFTIVDVYSGSGSTQGWGLLKSYENQRDGWISLDFATII